MVTFVCYHCDRTLKKKQVDAHIRYCGKPTKLACIDCRQWFNAEEQKGHISCVSEQEQWHGQFYKKKGEKGQGQQERIEKDAENGNGVEHEETNGNQKGHSEEEDNGKVDDVNGEEGDLDASREEVDDEEQNGKVEEWNGWKKTIRRIVKYSPGQALPMKKLLKKLKLIYRKGNVNDAQNSYDFAVFKAKANEKVKKIKCIKEQDKMLVYERPS